MKKRNGIKIVWISIIICFVLMCSPLIKLVSESGKMIFGVPGIYMIVFILWVILCILTFIGYKLNWGHGSNK